MGRTVTNLGVSALLSLAWGCHANPPALPAVVSGPVLLFDPDPGPRGPEAYTFRQPALVAESWADLDSSYTEWVYDNQTSGLGYYNDWFSRFVWARRTGQGRLGP